MDLHSPGDEREFRDRVVTWLHEHAPASPRPHDRRAQRDFDLAWQQTLFDGGWAGAAWPTEFGGAGLSVSQQLIWYEEYGRLGLPGIDACFVGNSHAGPTLIARGTTKQQETYLPPILRGEAIWCQGFSEPEAGSDLASLRTKAVVEGDELVVTGQKIWTSYADVADFQELLVRTDPEAPRHKGITWVICDMRTPGIEIRPIETIDGGHDFCEVFYDNVRIPLSNVVGELNDGWSVAMSTLAFERGTAFTLSQIQLALTVEELVAVAASRLGPDGRSPLIADIEIARQLATARAEVASLRSLTHANVAKALQQSQPGAEGSMVKLYYSDISKRVHRLAVDILGADGLGHQSDDVGAMWANRYLTSFAHSIGGGTSEIQRNIIGERVLGLPR